MFKRQYSPGLAAMLGALLFSSACDATDEELEEAEYSIGMSEAYEELSAGKADGQSCSGVVPPDSGPFDGRIALTFDDGPRPGRTERVMDILEAHGARATFFINGRNAGSSRAKRTMADVIRRGHILANHTQNHSNARNSSASKFRRDVDRTDRIITDATGIRPAFFRYPYGAANCGTHSYLRQAGYTWVGWHIDSADWCYANRRGGVGYCSSSTFAYVPSRFRNNMSGYVVSQAKKRNGGILLFHDIHKYTVDNLDKILTELERAGFRFVTLDDDSEFPVLNGETPEEPTRPAWIGDVCTDDAQCNFSGGFCARFGDKGFCSKSCDGYCPDRSGRATTFCVDAIDGQGGTCASKSVGANGFCAEVPGTSPQLATRYRLRSSAPAASARVCLP